MNSRNLLYNWDLKSKYIFDIISAVLVILSQKNLKNTYPTTSRSRLG